MKAKLVFGFASALALAACSNDAADDTATAEETAAPAPVDTAAAAAPDTATPQGFVDMAASSDMYEIEAGRLAEQNGTSEEVKQFGAMMAMDHTGSSEKLRTAATTEGLMVPTAMQPKHQQLLDALRNAGDNFDTLYAQQQVMAHQEALALMQSQAQNGTAAALKAFATETAPIIEGHLQQAQQLP